MLGHVTHWGTTLALLAHRIAKSQNSNFKVKQHLSRNNCTSRRAYRVVTFAICRSVMDRDTGAVELDLATV